MLSACQFPGLIFRPPWLERELHQAGTLSVLRVAGESAQRAVGPQGFTKPLVEECMNHWLKMNLKQANKIKGKIMWTADMTVLKMNIRVLMSRQGVPKFLICEHMVGNSFSTHLLWDISLGAREN